jgi:bifunctional non-homologous end joining protein LigD
LSAALSPHPHQARAIQIPVGSKEVELSFGRRGVRLTNLEKVLWNQTGATKRELLQYYIDIAASLFPHLCDRAIVTKRIPASLPDWIDTCAIEQGSGNVIEFPVINDLASLLWIVNLGCIELHPWQATCDDVNRPDCMLFVLDRMQGATFEHVAEAALLVRQALDQLEINSYAKTCGSRGIHIHVPVVRGPLQKDVWRFAKALAEGLAGEHTKLITAERRGRARVLVDYKQNVWGHTLASVYSVQPGGAAMVSTPVKWEEIERGIEPRQFRMDNVLARVSALGDLWKPILAQQGRLRLDRLLS